MKTSILTRNAVSAETVNLISRLVGLVPWPLRRRAMADVTMSLLDGRPRVAESVFGWGRSAVTLGINELRTGISCVNDLSARRKPKAEEKDSQLIADIREIIEPQTQADPQLRTALGYTNMTAQAVYDALKEKGRSRETLPTVRTISNILNRLGYRLRTVGKTKVEKKRQIPTRYSKTSGK